MEILENWINEHLRYPIKKTEARYFPINHYIPSIEIDMAMAMIVIYPNF